MKPKIAVIVFIFLSIFGIAISFYDIKPQLESTSTIKPTMKITSSAFENNQFIPSKYTCDGENINPPLQFSEIPDKTRSFVLIADDPDAPAGTWVHWVLYNIPPEVREIQENSQPQGTQGITSFGNPGYGGPCPPSGKHRYYFKLYALDTVLAISGKQDKKTIEAKMQNHILAQAELMGIYSRK